MSHKNLTHFVVPFLFLFAFGSHCVAQSSARVFAEPHVIRSLRQLHSAQMTYQATAGGGSFGSLVQLHQAGLIDDAVASGQKYGYSYSVSTMSGPPRFEITATPRAYRKSGIRSFYIDRGGEIRGGDKGGLAASSNDPVIDDCTTGSIQDNERCTILDMRALHSAQMTYAATFGNGNYGLMDQLYRRGLVRSDLADYATRGYLYMIQKIDLVPDTQPASFKIWSKPQVYGTTGIRSFYIDQTGVLRGGDKNGGNADQNDPPIND